MIMLTAKNLRKITNKYKDPDTYGGILAALESYAASGFSNICFRYKPTKKNRELVAYAIGDLTKQGFKVFYNDDDVLELDIQW